VDDLTPEQIDEWVEFWLEAGRQRLRAFEAAIMVSPIPEDERLAALAEFRARVGTNHLTSE
jgi:hypothetical protein